MIVHSEIDPVAFTVFGRSVHWYGLMYLGGFFIAWTAGLRLLRRPAFTSVRNIIVEDFIVFAVLGVIVGGRLGYVLFYNFAYYAAHPADIIKVWDGGMSFHGGLIGVIAFMAIYAKRRAVPFWRLVDFAAVLTPPGLGLGRIGNFINGELPGRTVDMEVPWAMVFPLIDEQARHPSQLYQAILEGAVLTAAMWWLARRPRPAGWLAAAFLLGYSLARFVAEFFREPDAHIGLLWGDLSLGQWLTVPMFAAGASLLLFHYYRARQLTGGETIIAAPSIPPRRREELEEESVDDDDGRADEEKIPIGRRLLDFLSATPDQGWESDQTPAQQNETHSPSRLGSLLAAWFAAEENDAPPGETEDARSSRRQKRRLKKKKRK